MQLDIRKHTRKRTREPINQDSFLEELGRVSYDPEKQRDIIVNTLERAINFKDIAPSTKKKIGRIRKTNKLNNLMNGTKNPETGKPYSRSYMRLRKLALAHLIHDNLKAVTKDEDVERLVGIATKIFNKRPDLIPNRELEHKVPKWERAPEKSRKFDIDKLSSSWVGDALKVASKRRRIHLALLALTGCRPSELGAGIEIKRSEDRKRIQLRVRTQKTTKKLTAAGYDPMRYFLYDIDHPVAKVIDEAMGDASKMEIAADPSSLARYINKLTKKDAWKAKQNHNFTAYTFRHQLATDMRARGDSPEKIMKKLGHIDPDTQRAYGLRAKEYGGRIL